MTTVAYKNIQICFMLNVGQYCRIFFSVNFYRPRHKEKNKNNGVMEKKVWETLA